jgi:replication factor A1
MQKEQIASLIEEIARMPEMKNVPREQIEATANEIANKDICLTPEEFKRAIKHRILPASAKSGMLWLSDLKPNMHSISVVGKILFVSEETLSVRDDKENVVEKKVLKGLISDNTKKLNFVIWNPDKYHNVVEKGKVLKFTNVYTTAWRDEPQINTSDKSEIEVADEDQLANRRYGTKIKIRDLASVNYPVTLEVRVLSVEKKEVTVDGKEKVLYSGVVGDDTGQVKFTAWFDFDLKENEVVRINGAYKKVWKDLPTIVIDEKTTVERLSDKTLPPAHELIKPVEVLIEDIYEYGASMSNVKLEGFIIEIKSGSGLIFRCPDCGLVLKEGTCKNHGLVTNGEPDMRIKAVFDDGTGAIIAVFPRNVCEKLLGKSISEYQALIGKSGITNPALIDINTNLLGKAIQVVGNVSTSELGTTLLVKDAQNVNTDMKIEAQKILSEMEA